MGSWLGEYDAVIRAPDPNREGARTQGARFTTRRGLRRMTLRPSRTSGPAPSRSKFVSLDSAGVQPLRAGAVSRHRG